jgi:hypothetical protein
MNKLGNIEHPTTNTEHPMKARRGPLSLLDVGCWLLDVFPETTGGRP